MDPSSIIRLSPDFLAALPVAALIVVGAIVLYFVAGRLLSLAVRHTALEETQLRPLRVLLRWTFIATGTVIVLGVFGFNLGGMWTAFTTVAAMVAVGFVAVWSVLSNVSCTFVILFTRPFAIGDELEICGDPVKGRVVDLTFVHTSLRAEDGSFYRIPNNLLFQKTIRVKPSAAVQTVSLAQQLSREQAAA